MTNTSIINNIYNSQLPTLQNTISSDGGEVFEEKLSSAIENRDAEEIKEACDQMESYMLTQIFKQMKSSVKLGESLLEKGDYEETFEDFLTQAQVENIIDAGGIGLSKMLQEALIK